MSKIKPLDAPLGVPRAIVEHLRFEGIGPRFRYRTTPNGVIAFDAWTQDEHLRLGMTEFPHFGAYAAGFERGYASSFVPVLDTPDARREMIVRAARRCECGLRVPPKYDGDALVKLWDFEGVTPEDSQDFGYAMGRHYRAWVIILATPGQFKDAFAPAPKSERTPEQDFILKDGDAVLKILKEGYTDAKPKRLVPALYALHNLGYAHDPAVNVTHLHAALCGLLGNIGTRQSLQASITNHAAADRIQLAAIDAAKAEIRKELDN